jgi:hypothetical protein
VLIRYTVEPLRVQPEGYPDRALPSPGVGLGVVRVLCIREEVYPVVLAVVHEDSQVRFQLLVQALRLSVSLGMERRAELVVDLEVEAYIQPELASEYRASIRQQCVRGSHL